ncbi:MAG TPA: tryptophan synthase subunit beta [Candidatus Limnocylindria bacterium]|nr:tryptophan synthase subunit beta [Candidatus Limnocylindria bacterium]
MAGPSVLDGLLAASRRRFRAERRILPFVELRREVGRLPAARPFESALRHGDRVALIAEVKRSSPSTGPLPAVGQGTADAREVARSYAAAGARALSILTEPTGFGGRDEDLAAAASTGLPTLRKDFVTDAYGVWHSRLIGADAVLLIARALPGALLAELIAAAADAGLDALVEVHDAAELDRALAADATLIGVNARDLATLDVDLGATLPLVRRAAEAGATVVAESGIRQPADVEAAAAAGAAAVLVGTSLLRAPDPGAAARTLVDHAPAREAVRVPSHPARAAVKVCGQRDAGGVAAAVRADADFVGFVIDPQSRRAVSPSDVARLTGALPHGGGPRPVLVTRAASPAEVEEAMRTAGVRGLQVAGFDEPPSWVRRLDPRPDPLIGVVHVIDGVRATVAKAEAWFAAGATHVLLEGASRDQGGGSGRSLDPHLVARVGRVVPVGIAGGLTPATVAETVRRARPALVDAAGGLERDGRPDPRRVAGFVRNARRDPSGADRVAADGRFGRFGGRYVPETLVPALDELEAAWSVARRDPTYLAELARLHRDFIGRPTPVFALPPEALATRGGRGATIWLKREDLAHTGAHKINNAVGQSLLARRMGKPRVIAETGAGQHGVATATACALLGLECVVYMGSTDIERQAPNVARMKLLGAEVRPVTTGNGTLRDALNEALRDWVTNVETTFYVLGSAAGPHPYPDMVASLQEVVGTEARSQLLERIGRVPDAVIACVGGGSNAIGIMRPFIDTRARLIGVEAGGRSDALGDHAASLGLGSPGVLHGAFTMLAQDEAGQIAEPHSVSAGLDYPGVGPQLAALAATGRLEVTRARDADALAATRWLAEHAGIIPALESAHAVAVALDLLPELDPEAHVLVNLSGRGDKDLGIIQRELGG